MKPFEMDDALSMAIRILEMVIMKANGRDVEDAKTELKELYEEKIAMFEKRHAEANDNQQQYEAMMFALLANPFIPASSAEPYQVLKDKAAQQREILWELLVHYKTMLEELEEDGGKNFTPPYWPSLDEP